MPCSKTKTAKIRPKINFENKCGTSRGIFLNAGNGIEEIISIATKAIKIIRVFPHNKNLSGPDKTLSWYKTNDAKKNAAMVVGRPRKENVCCSDVILNFASLKSPAHK